MANLQSNIQSVMGKSLDNRMRKQKDKLEKERLEREKAWYQKLIISSDNKYKQIFDVFVLLLVGYSCVASMYQVAFVNEITFTQMVID